MLDETETDYQPTPEYQTATSYHRSFVGASSELRQSIIKQACKTNGLLYVVCWSGVGGGWEQVVPIGKPLVPIAGPFEHVAQAIYGRNRLRLRARRETDVASLRDMQDRLIEHFRNTLR